MNCLVFLFAGCGSCVIVLLTIQRVKLKIRYLTALLLALVVISIYVLLPSCTQYESNFEETSDSFHQLKVHSDIPKRVSNRRELLHRAETTLAGDRKTINDILHLGYNIKRQGAFPIPSLPRKLQVDFSPRNVLKKDEKEEREGGNKLIFNDIRESLNDLNAKKDIPTSREHAYQVENSDNDENEQIQNSPRRTDEEEAKRAPKIYDFNSRKKVNFFQISLDEASKGRYLYDNQQNMKLLPHLTPKQIKLKLHHHIPWWEMEEIKNYPKIWFVGEKANKTMYNGSDPYNYGFDYLKHEEARLKIVIGDHLEYRYEILRKLGTGSFGTVVEAFDHAVSDDHEQRGVAIKVMHNDTSAERYFKQELDMMKLVYERTKASPRFSTVLRTFFFRNHLCIVLELLGQTLDEVHHGPLKDMALLAKYTQDVLKGLVILHDAEIIHGDLKPENLMLSRNCNKSCSTFVKIADFNLACIRDSEDFVCPGRYFQTRFYRAPEVILELNYTTTADMWSVGIILAEIYFDKIPIYGESTTDQLAATMEVLGLLPPYMVETSERIETYQEAVCYKCKNGFKRVPYRKSLEEVLNGAPADLFDFIKSCLNLDYKKRMTSHEALHHPFVTQLNHAKHKTKDSI